MIRPARRTPPSPLRPLHLRPGSLSLVILAASLLAASLAACKVDKAAFEARIFSCDTSSPDPMCGTDGDGKALTCFAARQIGGADFCTAKCGDVPMSLDGAECVQGGAELIGCRPSDDADKVSFPDGACGRSDLGCLRTDVLSDEGVCITMSPCTENTDCRDPVRSTCSAQFLKGLYAQAPDITSDHLYCLQEGCDKNNSACSPGETCLKKVIPAAANPIDICVPNCDSQGHCPPNHFCLSTVSGPANPSVCIPGLLGFVCQHDIDCLLGKCLSDGDPSPLSLCTATCQRDLDCTKYDSIQARFVCSTDGRCVTPEAYTGTLCRTTADCGIRDPGTVCVRSAFDDTAPSTCLRPCSAQGQCAARGGIGHTCFPFIDVTTKQQTLSCYPGYFGTPCFDKSQCAVPELTCVGGDASAATPTPGFCTIVCQKDADCATNRWTAGGAYCGAPDSPVCLPLQDDGTECQAAKQCKSQKCGAPAESTDGGPKTVCGGTA